MHIKTEECISINYNLTLNTFYESTVVIQFSQNFINITFSFNGSILNDILEKRISEYQLKNKILLQNHSREVSNFPLIYKKPHDRYIKIEEMAQEFVIYGYFFIMMNGHKTAVDNLMLSFA